MIDWGNLFANSLWIAGCGLALAVVSYTSWRASLEGEKLRQRLGGRGARRALLLAGLLFSLGLAATSATLFQAILWSCLALAFLIQAFLSVRRSA